MEVTMIAAVQGEEKRCQEENYTYILEYNGRHLLADGQTI